MLSQVHSGTLKYTFDILSQVHSGILISQTYYVRYTQAHSSSIHIHYLDILSQVHSGTLRYTQVHIHYSDILSQVHSGTLM